MKVLSLFDGMGCAALALKSANIEIESYNAFEIDRYAIETTTKNFPFIKHCGDVFKADFTQFLGVDLLCGGSPCTYWSIAQKNNRETEASGLGWELFSQFTRALAEAKPKFFIYENNKSMSEAIKQSINQAFGFEPILINSALVSAQQRYRYYWVGKRNEDGTYSKVNISQPKDKGLVMADVFGIKIDDSKRKDAPERAGCFPSPDGTIKNSQGYRIYSINGKAVNQTAAGGGVGAKTGLYAIPFRGEYKVENKKTFMRCGEYPLLVDDGIYEIRKLSVAEAKKLQNIPDDYVFPVSDTQAYKMLGNGWTVEVIAHILRGIADGDSTQY